MKKWLTVLLITGFLFSLVSCGENRNSDTESDSAAISTKLTSGAENVTTTPPFDPGDIPVADGTVYPLNASATWVKTLGARMERTEAQITCDWTCDGLEFDADCKGDVVFYISTDAECYFRAWVDGEAWLNGNSPYYQAEKGSASILLKNLTEGRHRIRIIKVTGVTLARAAFNSVVLNGKVVTEAPAAKENYIEFVGDSISCGWGILGKHDGTAESQDGSLAYPYLLAQSLDVDYSVVAVSGQGVVYGNPNISFAYKYPSYKRGMTAEYSFARKADTVILNVGTNDVYNAVSNGITAEVFRKSFKSLTEYIREKNGTDCKIIAVYGMMNHAYGSEISSVFAELGGIAENYYTFEVSGTQNVNGNAHPSAEEHVAYATELEAFVKRVWDGNVEDPEQPDNPVANGTVLYEQNFENVSPAENTVAQVLEALNWYQAFSNSWNATDTAELIEVDGTHALKLNGGWSAYEFLPATVLSGMKTYTIEMDLSITHLGVFNLVFNPSASYDEISEAKGFKGDGENAALVSFRNYSADGKVNGVSDSGTSRMGVNITNIKDGKQIILLANPDLLAPDESQLFGTSFHLSVEVNRVTKTVKVFVNNCEVLSVEGVISADGGLFFLIQNAPVNVDNIKVTVGTLADA